MVQAVITRRRRSWSHHFVWSATACLVVAGATSARAEDGDVLPSAFPISRYEKTISRSPFALPTASAVSLAPAQKQPGWSDDLFVAGVMTIGTQNIVTISQRGDAQRYLLSSGEESPQGVSVINIQWSEQLGQTRVTVKKGTEFAVLLFDQAALASSRSAAPAPRITGPTPLPGVQTPANNLQRPLQKPNPGVGPVLPNPGGAAQPVVPNPAVAGNPGGGSEFPRPRPRQIIRSEPNAAATPAPRRPVDPSQALPD
jgi:hypothetical protein